MQNNQDKEGKLKNYYEIHKRRRQKNEENEREMIKRITEKNTKGGGANSKLFCKMRKCIIIQNKCEYDLISEKDPKITDLEELKEATQVLFI